MFSLVSGLSHRDLRLLNECVEHEIILSETAIKEGFENERD